MKKLAIAALIICVASLSLYVREAFIIESDPYYLHHFTGKTKQQAEITVKDFRIVNPAPEDIKLISMTKNCSCIDLQLTMPGIKRNETATCRMTWNTGESA